MVIAEVQILGEHWNITKERHSLVHGHRKGKCSPTYKSWSSMKSRCLNSNNQDYSRYGGRGITISERWMKFINFLEDMGERPKGTTLERKETNGNYEKDNCKWADVIEQNNNKSNIKWLTLNDQNSFTVGT